MKVAIVAGTEFGTADIVARHAEQLLNDAGLAASYLPDISLERLLAWAPEALLVVTASTGDGELPANLDPLYAALKERLPADLRGLPGAILALGDSSYRTYCGAGELVRELYSELGIRELIPMLRLDGSETVDQETDAEPWLADFIAALQG